MWGFFGKKAKDRFLKEEDQKRKVAQSQVALLEAATTTADAAHHVTNQLKKHLEESIIQFETTVRILSDGLIVCDANGTVKAFNPAAEIIFACKAENIISKPVTNLFRLDGIKPLDQVSLWEALQQEKDGGSPTATLKGRRINGESFPLEATMTRLDRYDGSSVVLMLIRDLTTIVETSRELEIHAHRYRSIFNVSFDGILIVQNGTVVAANKASEILFGRDEQSLLSTKFSSLMDMQGKTLETQIGPIVSAEAKNQDGSMRPLLLSSVEITWNNLPARLLTAKDVSQMKAYEMAVKNIRDQQPDMIICFTSDFIINFANSHFCKYYNVNNTEVVGKDIRDVLSNTEVDVLRLKSLTQENSFCRSQICVSNPDGTIRIQDWTDHASYDNDGILVEYQRTGRDITNVMSVLKETPNIS